MKFALCSDLHLEFGPIELKNTEGADVLVLSGDILVAKDLRSPDPYEIMDINKSAMYQEFMRNCCAEFKDVIYIMGNHEHYHGDIAYTYNVLKKNLGHNENLHIMEKEAITIDDVTFICGTLWTDMNKEDPNTLYGIKGYMNDYRIIEDSNEVVHYKVPVYGTKEDGSTDYTNILSQEFHTRTAKFSQEKSVSEHKANLFALNEAIATQPLKNWIVVGHHAPSKQSTKPQYEKDVMVNGAYSSDLSEFILDHPQIKLWTHGHTHHNFDYMIGSARIVANPRGYVNYEAQADNFQLQFIEV
jgi:predicted phosphodiesterase